MVGFLKKLFRVKTKELEARLLPAADCSYGGKGEIELSWFSDGSVTAELELKHSGIADSSAIEFFADGRRLGCAVVQQGFAKVYEQLSGDGFTVGNGSTAELKLQGITVYEGVFRPD